MTKISNLGDRLKKIRKDKNLRQIDLASSLGLAQTTIANYEQGTRFPNEKTLSQIADFFNVSLKMPYSGFLGYPRQIDIITSNFTEAALILNRQYNQNIQVYLSKAYFKVTATPSPQTLITTFVFYKYQYSNNSYIRYIK